MKQIKIASFLIFFLVGIQLAAQNQCLKQNYYAEEGFLAAEEYALVERAKIEKQGFLDPVTNSELFLIATEKKSPELLKNTDAYRFELLSLLKDKAINSNEYTNNDLTILLYNLCLDNYIAIIDSVCQSVIKEEIAFSVLNNLIFQDMNLSNQLILNYDNVKVKHILEKVQYRVENKLIRLPSKYTDFIKNLEEYTSEEMIEFIKKSELDHPAKFKSKTCK
jgi:hypothetical protein